MTRRKQWQKILDSEIHRWSRLPYEQLISQLGTMDVYEVECDSKKYRVEIELLENTEEYVHVVVSVDDGNLPTSILPATDSFITKKPSPGR